MISSADATELLGCFEQVRANREYCCAVHGRYTAGEAWPSGLP